MCKRASSAPPPSSESSDDEATDGDDVPLALHPDLVELLDVHGATLDVLKNSKGRPMCSAWNDKEVLQFDMPAPDPAAAPLKPVKGFEVCRQSDLRCLEAIMKRHSMVKEKADPVTGTPRRRRRARMAGRDRRRLSEHRGAGSLGCSSYHGVISQLISYLR